MARGGMHGGVVVRRAGAVPGRGLGAALAGLAARGRALRAGGVLRVRQQRRVYAAGVRLPEGAAHLLRQGMYVMVRQVWYVPCASC